MCYIVRFIFFFFNDTATTEIYTLSLHDALPIFGEARGRGFLQRIGEIRHGDPIPPRDFRKGERKLREVTMPDLSRSEEHTSELQSRLHLVCRLLLEKKKMMRQK